MCICVHRHVLGEARLSSFNFRETLQVKKKSKKTGLLRDQESVPSQEVNIHVFSFYDGQILGTAGEVT